MKLPETSLYDGELILLATRLKIPHFRGIMMRDELPRKTHHIESGILNLQSHSEIGSHWTCWYKNGDLLYYFDSFGSVPPLEMITYLKGKSDRTPSVRCSAVIVQHINTSECGSLCLYFLKKITSGEEFSDILIELLDRYRQPTNSPLTI